MRILGLILIFIFLFPSLAHSKKREIIYTQEIKLSNEQIINCEALANYLNSKSQNFFFECKYLSPDDFIKANSLFFNLAIVSPPIFLELKDKFSKELHADVFPLFNISHKLFSVGGMQGAVFFARKDSNIYSLKDLKGKTLAIISECTSCNILTLYELKKIGIKERDLKIIYKKSWEGVIEAVYKGEASAGVVKSGVFEHLSKKGVYALENFRFLDLKNYEHFPFLVSSELVPDYYIIYSNYASAELLAEIYRILSPFVGKKDKLIPSSDLFLTPPFGPYKFLQMESELMLGPYTHLRKKIELERRRLFISYLALSFIGFGITLLIAYLYYKQRLYRRELEEVNQILQESLEIRSASLKLTSQKLSEEMKKLEKILATLEVGIALVDKSGAFIKVNRAFEEILSIDKDTLEKTKLPEIFRKSISCIECSDLNCFQSDQTKFTFKLQIDGQEKFLLIEKMPIEETTYFLVTIRDITLEKKWEEEIARYTQLETLRVIASGLAHDLNNLLGAIVNTVELIFARFSYKLPQETLQKLETIKKTSLRAKSLTQQLLIYGKSLILSIEQYSLSTWLKDLVELALAGSKIEVQYQFDPEVRSIQGDKNLLSIALHDLILNARHAMKDRGFIKISVAKEASFLVISILDTGPGMPEEIKNKLFQPFITTKPGGTGLGMFSAKRIIEAHGGKIEIDSSPGKGTLVKIYLPYKEDIEEKIEEEKGIVSETVSIPTSHSKKKILLMDDERDLREAQEELLKFSGYEVVSCETGEEALSLYQKEGPFDMVILDLTVPGKYDGIQTFLELKKIDPEVKAILATGYAYKREVLDAKSLGFQEVLIKPYSIEDLLKILEKIPS